MVNMLVAELVTPQGATAHEVVASRVAQNPDNGAPPGLLRFSLDDPFPVVAGLIQQHTGRWLGPQATWLRLFRIDRPAGLLVALHTPTPAGEVDLVVASDPGVVCRSALRAICGWVFGDVGATRLVVRIPAGASWLSDYARRAGFAHEGRSRDFFGIGADAEIWAMTRHSCRWLPRPPLAIPTVDTSPPSSIARH
ncbi:hypothetical protein FF100_03960 [Methylobacterium terricola]|uniref:N-acetyltransferase domain-containing protein n=1 Tax=Methylobacterium terricola TaxID=2583531 RepID=A0A5C4LQC3_9HYPH|nr:hypothetical protein [Methylobacterium terricola]TNC16410.1 hypothetical protein FF100_03960 [Methylobacterium terricola]